MSENKKLRALLVKARHGLLPSFSHLAKEIDAALAEPVSDDGAWRPMDALKQIGALSDALTLERSLHKEARAEVERLKIELSRAIASEMVALSRDEVRLKHAAFQDGFKTGAEAMREAAAQWIQKIGWDMNPQVRCSIRTLPIPEPEGK